MANRWGKIETVTDFIFLGSKTTVDSDCSLEIKSYLLLGVKAVTDLDSILKKQRQSTYALIKNKRKRKSRDITLQTKICPVKAMVFLVVLYRV